MNDTVTWQQVVNVPSDAPNEYKAHSLLRAKDEVSRKLYSILEQCKNPAVVEIQEKMTTYPGSGQMNGGGYSDYYSQHDEIRVIVKVTPVQHRHVEIEHIEPSFLPPESPQSFLKRLRYAITGVWHDR